MMQEKGVENKTVSPVRQKNVVGVIMTLEFVIYVFKGIIILKDKNVGKHVQFCWVISKNMDNVINVRQKIVSVVVILSIIVSIVTKIRIKK